MLTALFVGAAMLSMPATVRTPLLASYERLRYGMFIHYGMSTFTGIEIPREPVPGSIYQADKADPNQWVRTAKEAGMKYAVLTTKHCYGHCLWPSKFGDYGVTQAQPDVVREFTDACRRHGLKAGFYYLLGWDCTNQPKRNPTEYEAFCRGQIAELLTHYGPIVELWFDIPWDMGPDTQGVLTRMYEHVKSLQPNCLVMFSQSNNVMSGVADPFALAEATYFYKGTGAQTRSWPSDITNGERTAPAKGHDPRMNVGGKTYYLPMEVCDTLSPNWFWLPGDRPRPLRALQKLYQNSVGRHANLLLDVPPDRTGRIPDSFVRRLIELGRRRDEKLVDYAAGSSITASNVWHNDPNYAPSKAVDGNDGSRWATEESERRAWLEVDLGRARTIGHAFLTESYARVRSFRIEVREGAKAWRTVASGRRVGEGLELAFPAVRARLVRLSIDDSTGGPTIGSFEVW